MHIIMASSWTFDPAGMKVTAVYTNGAARDVTDYVTWSEEALTAEDTEFEIRFPYVKYQNAEGETGVPVAEPTVTVTLEIGGSAVQLGDVNGDGKVTNLDLGACATQYASRYFDAVVRRDGYKYTLHFERGEAVGGLKKEPADRKKTGSCFRWLPDLEVRHDADTAGVQLLDLAAGAAPGLAGARSYF